MSETFKDAVILNLAECDKVGQLVADGIGRTAEDFTSDVVELTPIALRRPLTTRLWQKLIVLLQRVMHAVKEVLAVQFNEGEVLGIDI